VGLRHSLSRPSGKISLLAVAIWPSVREISERRADRVGRGLAETGAGHLERVQISSLAEQAKMSPLLHHIGLLRDVEASAEGASPVAEA
jgi:hypothetical protein